MVAVLAAPAAAGSCPQAVVTQASDNGFFEFVMLNCIPKDNANPQTLNILGSTVLDAETCLATFNTETLNPGSNKIDVSDNLCSGAFKSVITSTKTVASAVTIFETAGITLGSAPYGDMCTYDAQTKALKMSYNCWFRLNESYDSNAAISTTDAAVISEIFTSFQTAAGSPLVSGACTPTDIRKLSTISWLNDEFQTMLKDTTVANYKVCDEHSGDCSHLSGGLTVIDNAGSSYIVHPDFAKASTGNYKATLTVDQAMCAGCFQTLMNDLQRDYSLGNADLTSGIKDSCKADPTSSLCVGTPYMAQKLADFKTCSGYDITFKGPLCTSSDASAVLAAMDPLPYQLFANCAINGASNSALCSSSIVSQFVSKLITAAGATCNSCFSEFYTGVQELSTDDVVKAACTSTTLTSDACKTALADPIAAFEECSGQDMVFAPASTNTTTTATPTDSNSSNVLASSIVGLIAIVALSTMM